MCKNLSELSTKPYKSADVILECINAAFISDYKCMPQILYATNFKSTFLIVFIIILYYMTIMNINSKMKIIAKMYVDLSHI